LLAKEQPEMTAARFSAADNAARRLRVVTDADAGETAPVAEVPLIGYVVLVPEGTDPTELFTADGTPVRLGTLLPEEVPAARTRQATPPASSAPAQGPAHGPHIDVERHTAYVDGQRLDLTYLEFELLAHLVGNPHRVHTRDHLVATLWGYTHIGDGRTVDVHIARLRRKLGRYRETIVTVRRVGYKYEPHRVR
jgi:Transcriptional regulatory protein, C terminal